MGFGTSHSMGNRKRFSNNRATVHNPEKIMLYFKAAAIKHSKYQAYGLIKFDIKNLLYGLENIVLPFEFKSELAKENKKKIRKDQYSVSADNMFFYGKPNQLHENYTNEVPDSVHIFGMDDKKQITEEALQKIKTGTMPILRPYGILSLEAKRDELAQLSVNQLEYMIPQILAEMKKINTRRIKKRHMMLAPYPNEFKEDAIKEGEYYFIDGKKDITKNKEAELSVNEAAPLGILPTWLKYIGKENT